VTNVRATITGFSHTFPGDVDLLLVGPSGQNVILLADVGGTTDVNNATLTFDDAAPGGVPPTIVSGTYRPTNQGAFSGTPPAPPGPYGGALAIFNGTGANGTWNLYAFDDAGGDTGTIAGGWSLDITTNGPTISSFAPTTGAAGSTVVIVGTNLNGATSVSFAGTPATSFVVVSPTQISAVVPAGATTGPITVTTPTGSASSATNFQASTPAPTITSFAPAFGRVGQQVVVTGTNLTGATGLRFAGTAATAFRVDSPTQISATIPAGAGAGLVDVTTPGGTGTSTTAFRVNHARTVSIRVRRGRARGAVAVADGFAKCGSGVPVAIQRRGRRGRWGTVGTGRTSVTGSYSIGGARRAGRYRAVAGGGTLVSGDGCLAATSSS
jgi:subtilisin-like proprotein convertase family protein